MQHTMHLAASRKPCMGASGAPCRSRPSPIHRPCSSGSCHQSQFPPRVALNSTGTNPGPQADSPAGQAKRVLSLKTRLLGAVCSLDRGLAANGREAWEVDELVRQLEATGGPVSLHWSGAELSDSTGAASTLDLLPGTWRLVYTSGFNTGSLGGRRPGPPAALVPSVLGQVYQRIDPDTRRLDNIVEFLFAAGLPSLDNLLGSFPGVSKSAADVPETPALRLTLKHDYELQGKNTVQIVYEDTSAELVGASFLSQLPKFNLPQLPDSLKPPRGIRSATFDVVFLDANMRITRGDRQELRIYLRDDRAAGSLGGGAVGSWSDDEAE